MSIIEIEQHSMGAQVTEENKLTSYFSIQLKRFRNQLRVLEKKQYPEDIHKFRLAIKKLRSISLLVEFSGNGNFSAQEHFDLIRKVFKEAGKVREIQMNIELIHGQEENETSGLEEVFTEELQKSIVRLTEEVRAFDKKKLYRLDKKFLCEADSLPVEQLQQKGLQFLQRGYLLVSETTKMNGDPQCLHKVRIKLREMLEVMLILKKTGSGKITDKTRAELKTLNELIGDWHDHQVLIDTLQSLQHDPEKQLKKMQIAGVIKVNSRKERTLRKKVVHDVQAHLSNLELGKLLQFTS